MKLVETQQEAIARLSRPSFGRFLLFLAFDWLVVAAGFVLFARFPNVIGFLTASVIVGAAQHALIVLGHEAVHYRVCRNRTLNEWVGRVFCFFPIGLTVSSYREFHFPHHRDPRGKEDPEMPVREAMGKNWRPPFSVVRGAKLWAMSFLGFSLKELGTFLLHVPMGNILEKAYMSVFWLVAGSLAYKGGYLPFVALWFYAQVTTYFSLLRFQAWYEHSLEHTHTNRYALPTPLFRLLLPHNIWVHYEHHKYPEIPFYNLEEVRKLDDSERIYEFTEMVRDLSEQASDPGLRQAS